MESAPCRSCKHFEERSADIEVLALQGRCKKGIIAKSFSVYGASSPSEGEAICASYNHEDDIW